MSHGPVFVFSYGGRNEDKQICQKYSPQAMTDCSCTSRPESWYRWYRWYRRYRTNHIWLDKMRLRRKICDTVAVTGEVYLHQHIGLGRAEQAVHSVSCLYSTVKCKHLQLFVIQTGANSMWRIMSGFVISHGRRTKLCMEQASPVKNCVLCIRVYM